MITDINATNGVTHTVESLVVPVSAREGYLKLIFLKIFYSKFHFIQTCLKSMVVKRLYISLFTF